MFGERLFQMGTQRMTGVIRSVKAESSGPNRRCSTGYLTAEIATTMQQGASATAVLRRSALCNFKRRGLLQDNDQKSVKAATTRCKINVPVRVPASRFAAR